MSEIKINKLVLQKGGVKYLFNPKGDIDLSRYYTKTEIDNKLSTYALKSEIPSTSSLATKTELNSVKSTAQNALNIANSTKVGTIYSKLTTQNRVQSYVTAHPLFLKYLAYFDKSISNESLSIDGFTPGYMASTDSDTIYSVIFPGLVSQGKTITFSKSAMPNQIIGEYLH